MFPRCLQALASNAPDMGLSPDVARVGHWLGMVGVRCCMVGINFEV